MTQNYTYKYRIYPTEEQKVIFSKHFGCCRFVYNYFLNREKEFYLNNKEDIESKRIKGHNTAFDNQKILIQLKNQEEFSWLKEVGSHSLGITLKNLEIAYNNFFKKRAKFPKFKKKSHYQSYNIDNLTLYIEEGRVYIPKIKDGVKIVEHRPLKGKILNGTISKTADEHYFIAITVEKEIEELPVETNKIGIDLGIKDFAVISNGSKISNPNFKKKEVKKLKKLQRVLSRKKKDSQRREKSRIKLARLNASINNKKNDFLHKLSSKLIHENQVICLEDLNIKGMVKNHKLAESISACSWFEFSRQLEYKGRWYGRTVIKIDRFFPSSKTCYNCGFIKDSLNLSERKWVCPNCGIEHDRDINAAKNILKQGMNSLSFRTNEYSRGDEVNLKSTKSGQKYRLRNDEKEDNRRLLSEAMRSSASR